MQHQQNPEREKSKINRYYNSSFKKPQRSHRRNNLAHQDYNHKTLLFPHIPEICYFCKNVFMYEGTLE